MSKRNNKLKFLCPLLVIGLAGCDGKYYNDEINVKPPKVEVGGSDLLTIQAGETITMENNKIRIVFNKNASIKELVNKEKKLYLVKESKDADAIRLLKRTKTIAGKDVDYEIVTNNNDEKKIQFTWQIENVTAVATASLLKDANEINFRVKLLNNDHNDTAISVEYPIIDGIDSLYEKETDYFVTPFVTGYLINNPVDAFNDSFGGIGRSMGMYPNGWGYPMQFSAYYSKGLGGFYWQTKDSGDTVKSFTFTGSDEKLRLGIYHYLSDIKTGDVDFDYDISISNLNEGSWYAAADKYKEFAHQQPWTSQGKLKDRTDYNVDLYENTALCMFGYRANEPSWNDNIAIYDMIKSRFDTKKIFNVVIYPAYNNQQYMDIIKEYDDLLAMFEFHTLQIAEYASKAQVDNAMLSADGKKEMFTIHYYECPTNAEWRRQRLEIEQGYIDNYDVDAYYYDVSIAAMHPNLCYDETHAHGTRVNVLQDFFDQYKDGENLANQEEFYSVGQEMIFEQLLPYVDYYQTRAGGGLVGYMEHDRIKQLIDEGYAKRLSLFDYIYHEYGALRLDGYLNPDDMIGQSYYAIAAEVALTGGIVEYNYEFFLGENLPSASQVNLDMVDYVNKLANIRQGIGKKYLVYGDMQRAPDLGQGTSTYEFNNLNYGPNHVPPEWEVLQGEYTVDNVISTAYRNGDSIGIFLANTKVDTIDAKFILHAGRDYGINEGTVYQYINGEKVAIAQIKKGEAKIDITLLPQEIYMLEIE